MTKPQISLYNTLTREKQAFTPIDPANVGMYVCGVTPYDDSHIGHARAYVVFDVLYRLLRHTYGEDHVKYVRNFTDIDDKIIQRAQELGQNPTDVAERNIASFYEDMDALNILRPNVEPRVSTSIPQIISMVDELIAKEFAYVTPSGDVIYRTKKFPKFGELARRKLDEQRHGERVKEDAEKESPNDFVLWKANAKSATKMEQAFVPAEHGAKLFTAPGRPGWHIECSAMSREHLGNTFDIHGGGEDLQFPHHCCEIAQSEALLAPGQLMANVWLHNGFITVGGTKMSKSLGNFTTIKQALEDYQPEAIRLWLLQTHYRKPVDYSPEALEAASNRYYRLQKRINDILVGELFENGKVPQEILDSLADDLNTAQALSILESIENDFDFAASLNFLGLSWLSPFSDKDRDFICSPEFWEIKELNNQVLDNQKEIDRLKAELESLLKERLASPLPTNQSLLERWVNLNNQSYKILGILSESEKAIYEARATARANKEWKKSDDLREELRAMGIIVEDGPQGQTWRRA